MIQVIKTMQQISLEDIKNKTNIETIEEYRQTNWKLKDQLIRTIVKNKESYEEKQSTIQLGINLEKISKAQKELYNKLTNKKIYQEITRHFDNLTKK